MPTVLQPLYDADTSVMHRSTDRIEINHQRAECMCLTRRQKWSAAYSDRCGSPEGMTKAFSFRSLSSSRTTASASFTAGARVETAAMHTSNLRLSSRGQSRNIRLCACIGSVRPPPPETHLAIGGRNPLRSLVTSAMRRPAAPEMKVKGRKMLIRRLSTGEAAETATALEQRIITPARQTGRAV